MYKCVFALAQAVRASKRDAKMLQSAPSTEQLVHYMTSTTSWWKKQASLDKDQESRSPIMCSWCSRPHLAPSASTKTLSAVSAGRMATLLECASPRHRTDIRILMRLTTLQYPLTMLKRRIMYTSSAIFWYWCNSTQCVSARHISYLDSYSCQLSWMPSTISASINSTLNSTQ